tara:strand:+ start:366 stop:812 length:447 start_codon:yes stop_codon:yes gene_type:complete
MAKRKTKSRRRTRNNLNLVNLAQGVVAGNILTQGMFGVDPITFLRGTSGVVGYSSSTGVGGRPGMQPVMGFTGIASGTNKISLMELFGAAGSDSAPVGAAIMSNLKTNWLPMTTGLIMTRVGFRVGKKFARPALTPIRRLLKGSGVTV